MIKASDADAALNLLEVDARGLDESDRILLKTIVKQFTGGPVGLDTLSAAIGEEKGTIEEIIEPYLIQQGLLRVGVCNPSFLQSVQRFGWITTPVCR